ncbi:MAG: hypothetical protein P4L50_23770 [Anaerolineaceae bacterium]|nr:hypothetical protein [Anaerolineaceae bacterium]
MILYALSIFFSAFLLFQVQPMISRYILPFFGGSTSVWSTVELFFQVFLTGGYAYAAWLVRRFSTKRQVWLHVGILAASLLVVAALGRSWPSPVTPDASWKPASVDSPITDIFKLLAAAVGLPYFLLATNSPLMQAWFHRSQPGRSPYWLYALSNIGSLLGLLAYPFLIEPNLTLRTQGWVWTGMYGMYVLIAGYSGLHSLRSLGPLKGNQAETESIQAAEGIPAGGIQPSGRVQAVWILLSAVASTMLLAVTSQITQEVAPIPLLWVLPLAIYLLSFILTYSNERWYNRGVFGGLLLAATAGFIWALANTHAQFVPLIIIYCFILFVSVMICNGETYRLRPDPRHLTRFYLMTSIGGALGGVFVNLVAPFVFKGYWELPVSFGLTWTLMLAIFITRKASNPEKRLRFIFNVLAAATVLLVGSLSVFSLTGGKTSGDVFEQRNFYGVVRVNEINADNAAWQGYNVVHGITVHGLQYSAADKRRLPTVYYTEQSGVGLAVTNNPKYGHGMQVGVLGLGIGTLAAYGQAGDSYRFYEINPIMANLSKGEDGYFSYLADSPAKNTIVLGDARISLERELATSGSNHFDVLVLDVFDGDSIPVHLLTKEAFQLYLSHLAPGGMLAVNISNNYLNLTPVLWQQAKYYQLNMVVIPSLGDGGRIYPSSWALLTSDAALLQTPAIRQRAVALAGYSTKIQLWTDDFSNLFQILR